MKPLRHAVHKLETSPIEFDRRTGRGRAIIKARCSCGWTGEAHITPEAFAKTPGGQLAEMHRRQFVNQHNRERGIQ